MGKILALIGVALLVCAVVAAGLYAWNGQWAPVVLAVLAAFLGKMALGLVEIILLPVTWPALHFAKRGNMLASSVFALLFGLLSRAAFAMYCAAVLIYLIRIPGPPFWLAVTLAVVVASAPFAWAAQKAPDDSHPAHWDSFSSMLGVSIAGILLGLGVGSVISMLPLAILFLISGIGFVIWWATKGAPRARLEHILGQGNA